MGFRVLFAWSVFVVSPLIWGEELPLTCVQEGVSRTTFMSLLKLPLDQPANVERLLAAAESRFKSAGVRIRRTEMDGRPVLILLPEGDAALNRLAANLLENGTVHEIIYDPVMLAQSGARATFRAQRGESAATKIFLPRGTPRDPADLRQLSLGHEVWHAKTERDIRRGVPGPFQGVLRLKKGKALPGGREDFYSERMAIDEVKAFSVSVHEWAERLNQAVLEGSAQKAAHAQSRMLHYSAQLAQASDRVRGISDAIAGFLSAIRDGQVASRSGVYRFETAVPAQELRIRIADGKTLGADLEGRTFAQLQVKEYADAKFKAVTREYVYEIPLHFSRGRADPQNHRLILEALAERVAVGELYLEYSKITTAFGEAMERISDPEILREIAPEFVRILRSRSFSEKDARFAEFFSRRGAFRRAQQKLPFRPPFIEYFHVPTAESLTRTLDGEWAI